jgi:hypothetical protein
MRQQVSTTNATIRWLSSMSFLETTAKYEMLMKKYTAVTEIMAKGAASLMVRTGSRTSESTELMLAYPMKDLEDVVSRKYMQKALKQMILTI